MSLPPYEIPYERRRTRLLSISPGENGERGRGGGPETAAPRSEIRITGCISRVRSKNI